MLPHAGGAGRCRLPLAGHGQAVLPCASASSHGSISQDPRGEAERREHESNRLPPRGLRDLAGALRPRMSSAATDPAAPPSPVVRWTEAGEARCARWRSESGAPPATRVVIADDRTTAEEAYGLACQGTALLWRGDFQNARQMLVALATRADRRARRRDKAAATPPSASPAQAFHLYRQARAQRARTLSALLVPLDAEYGIPLRRAPDMRQACTEAYGPADGPSVVSLRALLGLVGAHEWRIKGIEIAALEGRIHPHYGVFAPIRSEYVDLVAAAPLPAAMSAAARGLRHRHRDRCAGRGAGAARVRTCDRHRSGPARARVRAREHRAPRT